MTRRRTSRPTTVAAGVAMVLLLGACGDDGRSMREPRPDQTLSIITTTAVPVDTGVLPGVIDTLAPAPVTEAPPSSDGQVVADDDALALEGFEVAMPWPPGGQIPQTYTCDGDDISPALGWVGLPESTVEVAIVVIDPDANDFVHWIITGLDPTLGAIGEDVTADMAVQATNDAGVLGWSGPCPPDNALHTYRIEVHALSESVALESGAPAGEMQRAVDFATIAMAVGTGTYMRP